MPRTVLTPAFCEKAQAEEGKERTIYWSAKREGFGLMVTSSGARSFVVQYRLAGRSRRITISGQKLSLAEAERRAKTLQGQTAHGIDPWKEERKKRAAQTNTLRAIAQEFFTRARKGGMRSIDQREALFKRHIFPRFGSRPIDDIKRSEIVRLLDHVEDNAGATTAQHVLAALSRLFNWHASRGDDFRSPVVRGMGCIKQRDRARERVLTDDELRAVWVSASEGRGAFAALVKFLLLTAARRCEASDMRWAEIQGSDWTLPPSRNKTNKELVRPLSGAALEVLAKLPRINNSEFVFTWNGRTPISGFSKGKAVFDESCGVTDWTLHDLRRTARSLMSRAGVNSDIAEKCLGHVISGVRGIYDRHQYRAEMLRAYEALAAQIERIIDPRENVLPMRGAQ